MSYIGNSPSQTAFLTDQFSGTGSQTAFTMSVAPANTASCIVAVSGVLQDPSTYAVAGTTLNFTVAPPTGSGNISVRYLGIPASGVTTTAYRTVTEFTATASQTTFTPPSYTVGYLNVYRNGVLLGSADYTATTGTSVVLATGCVAGDLVTTESFLVSSVLNAIPNTTGSISSSNLPAGLTITTPTITSPTISTSASLPANTTLNSLNLSPYALKNYIINGGMSVWQRGTTYALTSTTSYGSVDRWAFNMGTPAAGIANQVASGLTGFQYALKLGRNSGSTSAAYITAAQAIETVNSLPMAGQTVTLSFYAKAGANFSGASGLGIDLISSTGTDQSTVSLVNSTWTGTVHVANQYQAITTTWTRYSFTGTVGSTATQIGLQFYYLTSGTAGADDNVYITGVQLEIGSYATPFEWRPYGTELQLCQRYYEQLNGNNFTAFGSGYAFSTTVTRYYVAWQVPKRTNATVTLSAASTFYVQGSGVGTNPSAVSVVGGPSTSSVLIAATGSYTAGAGFTLLDAGTSSATIQIAAEL